MTHPRDTDHTMAAKKSKGKPRPGNHVTDTTETLVVRVPKEVKRAYEQEADAGELSVADLVREDLGRGLKKRGYT